MIKGEPLCHLVSGVEHGAHHSGHDVDVRYVQADDTEGPITVGDANYDQEASQELVDLFLEQGAVMIFADKDAGLTGVRPLEGHGNHFHVRFADPDGLDN